MIPIGALGKSEIKNSGNWVTIGMDKGNSTISLLNNALEL
jgi:hypothetical protein